MPGILNKITDQAQNLARRGQGRLEKWMMNLFESDTSKPANRAALNLTVQARSALILSQDNEQGRAQIWSGIERISGQPMRVAYISDARALKMHSPEYLKQHLFIPDDIAVEDAAAVPILGSRRIGLAMAQEADLVIVEGNHLLRWKPKHGEWRSFPTSLHMIMKFSEGQTWEEVESGMYLQKRKIKTALRNGLTMDISKSEEDFDLFYDRMYVPMMEERHPGYGVIHPKESMRIQYYYGQLMLIRDPNGQAIGGGLFGHGTRAAFLIHTGLLDGNPYWYDQGASSALYYHSIRWFFDHHFTLYDAGGCRAFTSDGLYEFKRRWGMFPVPDLWNPRDWLFWVPSGSPVALNWLRALEMVPVKSDQHQVGHEKLSVKTG